VREIQTIEVVIFAAEVNTAIPNDSRAVNFESGLVRPNQRAVLRIDTVENVIEAARENLVFQNHGRGLHAVFAFELPNDRAVILIQAINISVSRRKIDVIVFERRLAWPGSAAPRIF